MNLSGEYSRNTQTFLQQIQTVDLAAELSTEFGEIAGDISTLESTTSGHAASITDIVQVQASQGAIKSVYIDNNGYISGYKLQSEMIEGTGVASTMAFHVDTFYVGKSGYTSQAVFAIDTVEGRVGIDGGLIVTGSINAATLDVDTLDALTADMDTLTAGTVKTTEVSTAKRVELSSEGTWPFWIGSGRKNAANGDFYYDKNTGTLVFKGTLSAVDGTFSGTLTASAVNAVDTINLAGESVTVFRVDTGVNKTGSGTPFSLSSSSTDWKWMATVSVTNAVQCDIILFFAFEQGYTSGARDWSWKITKENATTVIDGRLAMVAPADYPSAFVVDEDRAAGTHQYRLYWAGENANIHATGTLKGLALHR